MTDEEKKRGGKRPGAGRPKGSKDKEPRASGPETDRLWIRIHPHTRAAIEREALEFGLTTNQTAAHALDQHWRCPCPECRSRRREINEARTEGLARG